MGEQQRVGIARAVISKPQLLIADEPTGNLDPDLSLEIMNLLREVNAGGTTVLVATHDRELIRLVEDIGPQNAAAALVTYYHSAERGHLGRALVAGRSRLGDPILLRSDEVRLPARELAR